MHDDIKRFSLEGRVSDTHISKYKDFLVEHLEWIMREQGYAPVLDMDPQFTLSYIPEECRYDFQVSEYGVDVGKDVAWKTGGLMGGRVIMKYTPKNKSMPSSTTSE